ncbi:MAG: hypothetical protein ACOYMN_20760, partial [Roseimicrobium sp.]
SRSESAPRFTLDGDGALERHLRRVCQAVAEGVRKAIPANALEGVLLAGGYGRGEGGVLMTSDGQRPYNDMEFYVFVRGSTLLNDRRYARKLHALAERLSPDAGLEVEFKILSLAKLRRAPVSMFSYDFVVGHRWVLGDETLLSGCEHHAHAARIPLHEATRLLFNRCSGLLFAAERLRRNYFTDEDADFVGRNLAKAQLGIGDALLAATGRYHWSCLKRHEHLQELHHNPPADLSHNLRPLLTDALLWPQLAGAHEAGVVFKLHPRRSHHTAAILAEQHAELSQLAWEVWSALESARLSENFVTARDYALNTKPKCPEQSPVRNILVNAKAFGVAGACDTMALRYPRERLLQALALLLWDDAMSPFVIGEAKRQLRSRASSFSELVRAYENLWHRFN